MKHIRPFNENEHKYGSKKLDDLNDKTGVLEDEDDFAMLLNVSMVMMSHLSDVQEMPKSSESNQRINFVKFLILKYKDTDAKIDPEREWNDFRTKHPNL